MRPGISRNAPCALGDCVTLGLRAVRGLGSCGSRRIHEWYPQMAIPCNLYTLPAACGVLGAERKREEGRGLENFEEISWPSNIPAEAIWSRGYS